MSKNLLPFIALIIVFIGAASFGWKTLSDQNQEAVKILKTEIMSLQAENQKLTQEKKQLLNSMELEDLGVAETVENSYKTYQFSFQNTGVYSPLFQGKEVRESTMKYSGKNYILKSMEFEYNNAPISVNIWELPETSSVKEEVFFECVYECMPGWRAVSIDDTKESSTKSVLKEWLTIYTKVAEAPSFFDSTLAELYTEVTNPSNKRIFIRISTYMSNEEQQKFSSGREFTVPQTLKQNRLQMLKQIAETLELRPPQN